MKEKVLLSKLLPVLPDTMKEALQSEGLFDGQEPEVKRLAAVAEIKALGESDRSVERYVSTRDIDRDHEVLDPLGVVLDQFQLAPQVLWAHDYSLPPIGRAEWVKADEYGLRSKTIYAETERASEVWQLIKGGFLATASVGFLPVKRVWKGDADWSKTVDKYNAKWQADLEKAGAEVITTKWILLEYSDVPVPANPHALTYAVAKSMNLSDAIIKTLGIEVDGAVDAESVRVWQPVRPFTPPEPEPSRKASTGIVGFIRKPTPIRVIRPVKAQPTQADLIAHIAEESLLRVHGKL